MLALGAASLLACGVTPLVSAEIVGNVGAPHTGTAALRSHSSSSESTIPAEILGDVIVYAENGTWTASTTFRENDNGTIHRGARARRRQWTQEMPHYDYLPRRSNLEGDNFRRQDCFCRWRLTAVYERR